MPKVECCYDLIPSYMTGHSHEFTHIFIPISEMLYLRLDETDYWLNSSSIAFVSSNVFHRIICTEKVIWFNIPAGMLKKENILSFKKNPIFHIPDYLQPLIALIRYEIKIDSNSDSLRYLYYYLYSKMICECKSQSVQYMEAHYAEQISIELLAHLENYNPTYYISWFKNKEKMTPNEYLTKIRMEKAKELLINTQYRIIDIAMQTGYLNGSSFARAFRLSEGMSPQNYRKQNQHRSNYSKMPYWQTNDNE